MGLSLSGVYNCTLSAHYSVDHLRRFTRLYVEKRLIYLCSEPKTMSFMIGLGFLGTCRKSGRGIALQGQMNVSKTPLLLIIIKSVFYLSFNVNCCCIIYR